MNEHIATGHKFPTVKINTTYSFGIDDQEFVVAFETDFVGDFLDLMMTLRETEASKFTERDTPIFTCTSGSIREVLDTLGVAPARVAADT
jgi:chlorite dismutase